MFGPDMSRTNWPLSVLKPPMEIEVIFLQ